MDHAPLFELDARIRGAGVDVLELRRLTALGKALEQDLAEAERRVGALAAVLRAEVGDVARYERGVWGALYGLVADRDERLGRERREADVAATRHEEATAERDRLVEELAKVRERLVALADAEAHDAAALRAKEAALLAAGGPAAGALVRLSEEMAALEASLRATDEAIAAGHAAAEALARLHSSLASAASWGGVDLATRSALVSLAKRGHLDDARRLAGRAQAHLQVFQRELGDLGLALSPGVALAGHHRFLDTFFDNIFTDLAVQSRIYAGLAATRATHVEVGQRLTALTQHRAALAAQWSERERARRERLG